MKITVVGAGLAGAVAARILADAGHGVEVFESRDHIGGNCYDAWQDGILVHQYGPHCFHTDKEEVWDFVNRFTEFRPTGFGVMAKTRLGIIPIPFNDVPADHVVFTGSIDDYFGRKLGVMEYRSLDFQYTLEPRMPWLQLNECNPHHRWTRAVDHSHWLDQQVERTVIGREFPCEWDGRKTRFYPKPFGGNPEKFLSYWDAAKAETNVTFVGRLATSKYLDMDDVVAQVMVSLGLHHHHVDGCSR